MYFVDQDLLFQRLSYMEQVRITLSQISLIDNHEKQLAFERGMHVIIEALLDVGNQIIDGFMMKDPGGYEDMIIVLRDEHVISFEESRKLIELVSLRKQLVQDYTHVQVDPMVAIHESAQEALLIFPKRIKEYMDKHSQEVTAFVPKKGEA